MTVLTKAAGPLTFFGIPAACYVIVKAIPSRWVRTVLGGAASTALIVLGTSGLPQGKVSTMMSVSISWMLAIRLVHLTSLPDDKAAALTPFAFIKKFILQIPANSTPPQHRRPVLTILKEDLIPQIGIAAVKFVVNSWLSDYLLEELQATNGETLAAHHPARFTFFTFLYGSFVLTSDYFASNLLPALCSFISGDRYRIIPFNDSVFLSNSPRVFWGRRYNRIVSTLLNESVFQPLRELGFSADIAALTAFTVSGALHVHVANAAFGCGEKSSMLFFLIQGALCFIDNKIGWSKGNKLIGWAANSAALIATLPLYLGLFIRISPAWMINNPLSPRPPHWLTLSAIRELLH